MFKELPRRKRRVAITLILSLAFLVVTVLIVWAFVPSDETYRPGETIEGLTAALARSLPENYPRVVFVDATREAGIDFHHFSGTRSSQLPEDMGSGVAWGDYDNDGWPDLYVVNLVGPLTMTPDEVAASPAHNALYHNNGDGTFTDATTQAGLGGLSGFWAGASWSDYDRDGDLDLYVTGYVQYRPQKGEAASLQYDVETPAGINPSSFEPERNLLYRNDGNGTFTEVAEAAGVANAAGRSLSAAWADFDEDGWPDLYVANDVSDNVMYRNRGNGTFEEISHAALVADYRGAMGLAVGDWDGDADLDLFVTHWIAQENALYGSLVADARGLPLPRPNGFRFMDVADQYGLGQIALDYIGWGTSFFDYNNDGRLDLFVVNGSTFQQPEAPEQLIPMRDQLFWNRGPEAGFFDVSSVAGAYFEERHVGRGAAFADYDRDGDVDVFVVNHGGSGVLLRNDGGNAQHWLEVALEGRTSNRSALGAWLRVVTGDRVQVRHIGAQASYISQNSPVAHVGLGTASVVDSLVVTWPRGRRQVLTDVPSNQRLSIQEDEEGV